MLENLVATPEGAFPPGLTLAFHVSGDTAPNTLYPCRRLILLVTSQVYQLDYKSCSIAKELNDALRTSLQRVERVQLYALIGNPKCFCNLHEVCCCILGKQQPVERFERESACGALSFLDKHCLDHEQRRGVLGRRSIGKTVGNCLSEWIHPPCETTDPIGGEGSMD